MDDGEGGLQTGLQTRPYGLAASRVVVADPPLRFLGAEAPGRPESVGGEEGEELGGHLVGGLFG